MISVIITTTLLFFTWPSKQALPGSCLPGQTRERMGRMVVCADSHSMGIWQIGWKSCPAGHEGMRDSTRVLYVPGWIAKAYVTDAAGNRQPCPSNEVVLR